MTHHFKSFAEAKAAGMKYALLVGRRQPLHQGHLHTIRKNREAGFIPLIIIGSSNTAFKTNGFCDTLFDPIRNPLTPTQQREQIRLALPDYREGVDYLMVEYPDLGHNERWCRGLVDLLQGGIAIHQRYPNLLGETFFHFIGKPEDAIKKDSLPCHTRAGGYPVSQEKLDSRLCGNDALENSLTFAWEEVFAALGLADFVDEPHPDIALSLSSTLLRQLDVNHLSAAEHAAFATPDFIRDLANQARADNPSHTLLDAAQIPITLLDASLMRLHLEKNLSTAQILAALALDGEPLTLSTLTAKAGELNRHFSATPMASLTLASASCNQTAYNYATNLRNICLAIDTAADDKADILALEELGLVGYGADDYHQWNKNNETVWEMVQEIASYALQKAPNLILSLGCPWHYADKTRAANHPLYNLHNRPYNVQMTIANGEVIAIAAKSLLADGAAEYESRQFLAWDVTQGTIPLRLPNGNIVPFGKPVVGIEDTQGNHLTLFHEICAEAWVGIRADASTNASTNVSLYHREVTQARYLALLATQQDISIVLNPSASKPEPSINKEAIRKELCLIGSRYAGVYVYTNALGTQSGTMAMEGSQIFAQNGEVIHQGQRYSFKPVSYSSVTVNLPMARRNYAPDARIIRHLVYPSPTELWEAMGSLPHKCAARSGGGLGVKTPIQRKTSAVDATPIKTTGSPAAFEARGITHPTFLIAEETLRSVALWLRDYMQKQPWCQGYVISLSGGKDSAFGAVAVTQMIELEIAEKGLHGFFEDLSSLQYQAEILAIAAEQGEKSALTALKKRLLTCVYLPTDNSSKRTRHAARFLIEGGEREGIHSEGIGGSFYVAPQQSLWDEAIIAYAGLDIATLAKQHKELILSSLHLPESLDEASQQILAEAEIKRLIKRYVNAAQGSKPQLPAYIQAAAMQEIPTWAEPRFDLTLQNFQARIRVSTPWAIANTSQKIALVTSNASEADLGYTTAGGDMHLGGANPIGGIPKDELTSALLYCEEYGLAGLSPLPSLYYINQEQPTAELRKAIAGEAMQSDEADIGFSYAQGNVIRNYLIIQRKTAQETFALLQKHALFPQDIITLRNILLRFTKRWEAGQFKRTAGTLAPHLGGNVDPHHSVRTHEIGDHFRTPMAELTLHVLHEIHGEAGFYQMIGMNLPAAIHKARLDEQFKQSLGDETIFSS
jgi:NH3-dependent NAD+ synthetase/predicted amidohydrolase